MLDSGNDLAVSPYMAPLSMTMIRFLADQEKYTPPPLATTLQDQITQATQLFRNKWTSLVERVMNTQSQIYTILAPHVFDGSISSEWVAETLSDYTPNKQAPFTVQTLSRWHNQGILRYIGRNRPDPDNVAALLTLRFLDQENEKGWYPTKVARAEPLWYCWRQDSPTSPIVPCPANPLPEDLPRKALLFTNYRLAGLKPDWLPYGNGAIRWAGTTVHQNKELLWDLSAEEIEEWDDQVISYAKKALNAEALLTRSTLAQMILLRLAEERLSHPSSSLF